ncbi:MAG TPA: PqqD family protein [Sphingomonas sp.]|nr:PqqD family protein [Sphingomonas sp.]
MPIEDARFTPAGTITWHDAGDELALFDQVTESYFALNGSAAAIWRELAAGRKVTEAASALATQFDADPAAIAADIAAFVADAITRNLLVPAI